MSHPKLPNKVTIVGGGTAGWMTAAALSKTFGEKIQLVVVEPSSIGTIGVGEATVPSFSKFNKFLGISESEFLKATKSTYKMGIEFQNWNMVGDSYIHPFGVYGMNATTHPLHQYWLALKAHGDRTPLSDYSLCALAAKAGKAAVTSWDENSPLAVMGYAYHIDANLYADCLRSYCFERGVKRIDKKVVDCEINDETGLIETIIFDDHSKIQSDFFVDCSGFRSLILGKALGIEFEDWSHLLPCNRAVTAACKIEGEFSSHTVASAHSAGWQWRIPLQHRVGNGHIYCSAFKTDDAALSDFSNLLEGEMLSDPKFISFKTGIRKRSWHKNCVAIGLSAGFLEPLESTSIHLIQAAIMRLIDLFPDMTFSKRNSDEFNRLTSNEVIEIRDMLIFHYYSTSRTDSPFWLECQKIKIPDSLKHKIEFFRDTGKIAKSETDLFRTSSWSSVFLGQGIIPKSYDSKLQLFEFDEIKKLMKSESVEILKAVSEMLEHKKFLQKQMKS